MPGRGARKCEVYCVIGEPSALRDSMRINTPRSAILGISFSIPIDAICSGGTFAERSALPSFVHTTTVPVSATAKLQPVIPAVFLAHEIRPRVHALAFGEIVNIAIVRVGADGSAEQFARRPRATCGPPAPPYGSGPDDRVAGCARRDRFPSP